MPSPLVSVVTTTLNGARFLGQTIESVLNQTFTDFEYLIVDDASTDCSPDIIAGYAALDSRIRVIRNDRRLGPAGALNRALHAARGEYFANLDHDDLAMPNRLEYQTAFLEGHASVGVVGSFVRWIDEQGQVTASRRYPTGPGLLRWGVLFRGCVVHSSALMRRFVVLRAGGYSLHHRYACDYELWTRLIAVTEFDNVPEYLAAYRRTEGQASRVYQKIQQGQVVLLMHAMFHRRFGVKVPLQAILDMYWGISGIPLADEEAVTGAAALLESVLQRYLEIERPEAAIVNAIHEDCALMLFRLAHCHRERFTQLHGRLLERALQLDPLLLTRRDARNFRGESDSDGTE